MNENGKKKVALWGAGKICKKRYPVLRELFQIECCYDNDEKKWGTFLYNVPIKEWGGEIVDYTLLLL